MQQALGRAMFSLENYTEPKLGLSMLSCSELFFLAPVREEMLYRVFVLHILRYSTPRSGEGKRESARTCERASETSPT